MQKQIVRNESMRTVIRYAFWLLSLFLMSEIQAVTPQKAPLKLGAERMDVVTRLLKDKQVGLVVTKPPSSKSSRSICWTPCWKEVST